ncbi:nitrogen regulatory protein PII [Cenarchaeum symbiosum A]|uniref:Nitrogen regulatory protein PII n=1 Tax=Cenarchaeum symbiosum (strain A) TaxID=414004 RepID=A0RYL7_CENSY|nr:nitrogen regulatory protein PII [Cenarchaeum symbiosum A]
MPRVLVKRLDIIIRTDKRDAAIRAIRKVGVGGLTVSEVQGQGAEEKPLVGEFHARVLITTVAEEEKLAPLLKAVGEAVSTGCQGDGKVFVSNVEEVMDLRSKECGHTVL